MKTVWKPAKSLIFDWYVTVKTRLFPETFHALFGLKEILAGFVRSGEIESKRHELKQATDALVDKVLACTGIPELEQTIRESDPTTAALYYDRVVHGTWFLDHMIPVRKNQDCEIPKDWNTFVRLLLRQEWFV